MAKRKKDLTTSDKIQYITSNKKLFKSLSESDRLILTQSESVLVAHGKLTENRVREINRIFNSIKE